MSDWLSRIQITITDIKGSAPREIGASMTILQDGTQTGTIGGGALEWQATHQALKLLKEHDSYLKQSYELILGPDLEQCCGGVVQLSFELFTAADQNRYLKAPSDRQQIMLFGAGHVGKALVNMLCNQEFDVDWVDSRCDMFPDQTPENVNICRTSQPVQAIATAVQNTFVLIMTHCHQTDFKVASAALQNHNVCFTGLIGSATKKARFVRRFADDGLTLDQIASLVCPIGIKGISSKRPEAVAASVLAQLLMEIELVKTDKNNVLLRRNHA